MVRTLRLSMQTLFLTKNTLLIRFEVRTVISRPNFTDTCVNVKEYWSDDVSPSPFFISYFVLENFPEKMRLYYRYSFFLCFIFVSDNVNCELSAIRPKTNNKYFYVKKVFGLAT